MPLPSTLQLLLRPTPIGLDEYHHSISNQAALGLGSELFSDLTIQTPDGSVSCHQSILVPLSSLLKSVLHPNPFFPGLVHTVVVPIEVKTIETILKIIYTGKAFIRNKANKDKVLSGLKVLGIHLSGLVFSDSEGFTSTDGVEAGLHCMTWGDDQITTPSPISTSTPQATSQPPTQIVQPSTTPYMDDVKPLVPGVPLPPNNQLPTRLDKIRVQLGRDKLRTLAKHFKDHKERDFYAFKCSECDKRFKHKKLLEIHRIQHHENLVVNPLFNGEELANCENNNIESSPASKKERIKKRKRNMDDDDESTEGAAVVSEALLECTLCSTPVSSKWYLPPSRHGCTVNNTQTGQKITSTNARKTPKTKIIRGISVSRPAMPEVADKIVLNTHEINNTDNVVPIKGSIKDIAQSEPTSLHECPLTNCARQCRSKADLQVHLAMSHYKEELEKEYITDCGETRCKVCEKILPSNKQGFLKHMAVDHNVVMDYVERDRALEELHKASPEQV